MNLTQQKEMMKKILICTSEEIKRIQQAKNEPFCLVRPLREQPPKGYEFMEINYAYINNDVSRVFRTRNIYSFADCYKNITDRDNLVVFRKTGEEIRIYWARKLPFAKGNKLVVKETYRLINIYGEWYIVYRDGYRKHLSPPPFFENFEYLCDKWRSGATMPQWASRYTLTVVGEPVVKRVQEITDDKLIKLGVKPYRGTFSESMDAIPTLLYKFANQWDSRYGKRYLWKANPFVELFQVERSE